MIEAKDLSTTELKSFREHTVMVKDKADDLMESVRLGITISMIDKELKKRKEKIDSL